MTTDELEIFLEITLGQKMASDVSWEAGGDPCTAAEVLNRRAATLAAPFRGLQPETARYGRVRKDMKLLQLVAKLLEEVVYELDEEHDVELVRSA